MGHRHPLNLWQGIRLVQAGRKHEALPYLRYAARNESLNAEGWLWLAAASDDREEYRHCVQQALGLDPGHPVARQMRQALEAQEAQAQGVSGYGLYTPPYAMPGAAAPVAPDYAARPRRRRRRRALWALIALVGIGVLAGAALLLAGPIRRAADELRGEAGTGAKQPSLEVVVGSAPGFRFRMTVPPGWLPADIGDPAWVAVRDGLAAAFGSRVEGSVWEQVGASFGAVKRDPVYGQMIPSARVVDTDDSRLRAYGVVTALSLDEIKAFPAAVLSQMPEVCDRMRVIQDDYSVDSAGVSVMDSRIVTRAGEAGCALVVERAISDPTKIIFPVSPALAPDSMREVVIAVPVGGERYALWRLTLAEDAYPALRRDIEHLIETLEYVGE